MICVLSPSSEESINHALQQCELVGNAAVLRPELVWDGIISMNVLDPELDEASEVPNIIDGSSTVVDLETCFFAWEQGLTNLANWIRENFKGELTVFTGICNLMNMWRKLGFETIASTKVAPDIYRIVFKLR
jgi:hypothetical protein